MSEEEKVEEEMAELTWGGALVRAIVLAWRWWRGDRADAARGDE